MTESSKQRPPREFWLCITDEADVVNEIDAQAFVTEGNNNGVNPYVAGIHVIEANFAKELEAKLAVAVKALELWTQPVPEVGECRDEHEAINRVFNSVRLRQKEALEQIGAMK